MCNNHVMNKKTCFFHIAHFTCTFQRPGLFVTAFFTKKANHLAVSSQPGSGLSEHLGENPNIPWFITIVSKHSDKYTQFWDRFHVNNLQKTFFTDYLSSKSILVQQMVGKKLRIIGHTWWCNILHVSIRAPIA